MNDIFLQTVDKYNMINNKDRIIVALSGGADSVLLFNLLFELKEQMNFDLQAAHVNHNLREEADEDQKFVQKICDEKNIKLHILNAKVSEYAKENKIGLEEAGRKLRYDFFDELIEKYNAKIATAHNLNDRVETLLLNLIRGCGIAGLTSIPYTRGNYIRPILDLSREKIESLCLEMNLTYVSDKTNFETDYNRNKIRLNIIPEFYKINANVLDVFKRNFEIFEQLDKFIEEKAQEIKTKSLISENKYDTEIIKRYDKVIIMRFLSNIILDKFNVQPSAVHLNSAIELLEKNSSVDLPGGRLKSYDKILYFPEIYKEIGELKVDLGNNKIANGKNLSLTKVIKKKSQLQKAEMNNYLDYKKVKFPLYIRSRKPNDKIKLAPRNLTKTLKQLFNEKKIPVENRNSIVLLFDNDDNLIFIEKIGVDESVKIDSDTTEMLEIMIRG
ncbi:MAG: tRNA lysidine(34) synthetase TilS [Clostridia bacterium]|nr:tRNA lysidine(34) synthetase TilS [Clostridia bacterium]